MEKNQESNKSESKELEVTDNIEKDDVELKDKALKQDKSEEISDSESISEKLRKAKVSKKRKKSGFKLATDTSLRDCSHLELRYYTQILSYHFKKKEKKIRKLKEKTKYLVIIFKKFINIL